MNISLWRTKCYILGYLLVPFLQSSRSPSCTRSRVKVCVLILITVQNILFSALQTDWCERLYQTNICLLVSFSIFMYNCTITMCIQRILITSEWHCSSRGKYFDLIIPCLSDVFGPENQTWNLFSG